LPKDRGKRVRCGRNAGTGKRRRGIERGLRLRTHLALLGGADECVRPYTRVYALAPTAAGSGVAMLLSSPLAFCWPG